MSQSESVTDPITLALARRREAVEESERDAKKLEELLSKEASLDPTFLVELLAATWARLPDDLTLVGWESGWDNERQALTEALAIGAKVADVLEVYSQQRKEACA